MIKDHIKYDHMDLIRAIKIGDTAHFEWTNNYLYFSALVEVTKINRLTIRGKLLKQIKASPNARVLYEKGAEITVPVSPLNKKWTRNNRVYPYEKE